MRSAGLCGKAVAKSVRKSKPILQTRNRASSLKFLLFSPIFASVQPSQRILCEAADAGRALADRRRLDLHCSSSEFRDAEVWMCTCTGGAQHDGESGVTLRVGQVYQEGVRRHTQAAALLRRQELHRLVLRAVDERRERRQTDQRRHTGVVLRPLQRQRAAHQMHHHRAAKTPPQNDALSQRLCRNVCHHVQVASAV